jgi:hypothetical protein
VELTLPRAAGTVPVRVTGAVEQLVVRAPGDSPVRLVLASGARTVAAGDRTERDVPPGATFTPRGGDKPTRYDLTVDSRPTLISVENRA